MVTSSSILAQEKICFYQIPGIVPLMKQPKEMDCWITAATMMLSWKDSANYTIEEVVQKLGDPWVIYYNTNTGLPPGEQKKFMAQVGLRSEPPANYLLTAYVDLLKSFGPLWITIGSFQAHVRILIGIEGDGSYEKTIFLFIEPQTGAQKRQNAMRFFEKFELEAKASVRDELKEDLRAQIYHF